ncbi:MAG: hypothetical protein J6V61_05855 [Bacteroidaceae bacterium]|nr:hypothetical protein [Bacteroidaceae bacterium]
MKKVLLVIFSFFVGLAAKAQVTDYQNWMAQLDDDAFVCQLSIPGAHDACSSSFSSASALGALFSGKVQTKSVEQMLPLGTRLFDLRPAVNGNKLTIYHGVLQTSSDFNTVMQQLCNYVTTHPTEFCVVVIRHETDGDDNNANFGSMLQTSLTQFSDYLVNFRPNLTVGEVRGKILFLSRDEYNAPIRGGRITGWPGNTSSNAGQCYGLETHKCSMWVQDFFEYSDVNDKKNSIEAMLNQSRQLAGKYNYTWVINETSGYKGTGTNSACQTNAKNCNKYMQELLASGNYNGPAGLVFMDYAADGDNSGYYGLSLTKELINHNFRYTMAKQGDAIYDASGNLFVAPKGRDMMWKAKFLRKEGPSQPGGEDGNAVSQLDGVTGPANWYTEDFDDSGWQTKLFPTASANTGAPYYSQWNGTYNVLFIRREFYLDHDPSISTYRFYTYHDDDYRVYLNGVSIDSENGWSNDFNNYRTVNIPSGRLKAGRNVLAIMVQQNWGGAYFDCGILRVTPSKVPLKLTGTDWQTYVTPGFEMNFSSTNVKAYQIVEVVEGNQSYARAEEVSVVPANQAVLVRSDNGAGTYQIPVTRTSATLESNLLKASTEPITATAANTIYCLANVSGNTGFYPVAVGTTLPQGKGYLDMSGSNAKPARILLDGNDATGIAIPTTETEDNAPVFNLSGQRLSKPQHGINIIGGKKILK